jgi:hypothetical protein
MADHNSQLIIRLKEARPEIIAFYENLDSDASAQKQFLADPEAYLKAAGVPSRLSTNSRLLFSLMSNNGFTAWAKIYEETLQRRYPSGTDWESVDYATVIRDVYNAIVAYADQSMVSEAFGIRHPTILPISVQPTPEPLYTWHWSWLYVAAYVLPVIVLLAKPIESSFISQSNLANIIDTISTRLQRESDRNRSNTE